MKFLKAASIAGIMAIGFAVVGTEPKAAQLASALSEGQGVTTELGGDASALTYWVKDPDGWKVVTTVDTLTGQNGEDEGHAVVRFSSVLLPGQSQVISVPFAAGQQQQALRVRRTGDQIEIERVAGS